MSISKIALNSFIASGTFEGGHYGSVYSIEQVKAFNAAQAEIAAYAIAGSIRNIDWTFVEDSDPLVAFAWDSGVIDVLGVPAITMDESDDYIYNNSPPCQLGSDIPFEF